MINIGLCGREMLELARPAIWINWIFLPRQVQPGTGTSLLVVQSVSSSLGFNWRQLTGPAQTGPEWEGSDHNPSMSHQSQ